MHRRQVLASVALLPAAGCLGIGTDSGAADMAAELPTAALSMTAVTDADVARKLTHHEVGDDRREMLDRIVEDGPTTTDWYQEPPVHTALPVLHEGTVYRLSRTVVDQRPVTNYSVLVDIPQTTPDEGATVQFRDLPAADRAVFERHGFADGAPIGVGTVFAYTPDEEAASVLVPEPEYDYIAWEGGETAEWVVDDGWAARQKRYRYEAERVASNGEYGRRVRDKYAFELSELTEGERDIVREAVENEHGYTVSTDATPSLAFEALVDRFRPRDELAVVREPDPDVDGRYLVRYDGTVYWTELRVDRGAGDSGNSDDASDEPGTSTNAESGTSTNEEPGTSTNDG